MRLEFYRALALATALLAFPLTAAGAPSAAPIATPKLPARALHVDLQVEVNKLGQVVRVPHGNLSGDTAFDTMTIGNALQMWIRVQRGSTVIAISGLYRVDYNYDPATHNVKRTFRLLSRGGTWANDKGAANVMVAQLRREQQEALARLRAEQRRKQEAQSKNLPDINGVLRKAIVTPTPSPRSSPHA